MKFTPFVAAALFVSAVVGSSFAGSAFAAVTSKVKKPFTCETVNALGVETAIKFSKVPTRQVFSLTLQQLRVAVKAFYKDAYSDSMTIEQANALGEEVGFSSARGPDGAKYSVVNVGFGGGNSASHFFKEFTLDLAPVVIVDGIDCVVLGKE